MKTFFTSDRFKGFSEVVINELSKITTSKNGERFNKLFGVY